MPGASPPEVSTARLFIDIAKKIAFKDSVFNTPSVESESVLVTFV
jgi:hypothetical protein